MTIAISKRVKFIHVQDYMCNEACNSERSLQLCNKVDTYLLICILQPSMSQSGTGNDCDEDDEDVMTILMISIIISYYIKTNQKSPKVQTSARLHIKGCKLYKVVSVPLLLIINTNIWRQVFAIAVFNSLFLIKFV